MLTLDATEHIPLSASDEGLCLTMSSVEKLRLEPVEYFHVADRDELSVRAFCEVMVRGKPYLADKITGSLYLEETGLCITGQLRITGPAEKPTRKQARK